jgi:wyosine [tRNA(Phe)-imidazoG37] synthetase (radical SAM superfamily)
MNTTPKSTKCVFGPVPSRRLGRSLGVDLVPFKTCTYDCIYCQLGRTTCRTIQRKEWVPLDAVLDELKLQLPTRPDYITLSGSGEPTLHSRIGQVIDAIQVLTSIPVAVLTNGSLLWQPDVRAQLANADVVLPSLDAGDEFRFRALNRPHEDISFERMLEGLVEFRREFRGQYWLEIFLLDGYTALPSEVAKLAKWVKRIHPDKVQLNTVARPPAEHFAMGVPPERLKRLANLFRPRAEVIAEHPGGRAFRAFKPGGEAVLALLRRRPCLVEDVARGLGLHRTEALKLITDLEARRQVVSSMMDGRCYYRAAAPRRLGRKSVLPDHNRKETAQEFE